MKFFNGASVEVVLTPSNAEMESAMRSARQLMARKMDQWILDQLTMEQLVNVQRQVETEIKKRRGPKDSEEQAEE